MDTKPILIEKQELRQSMLKLRGEIDAELKSKWDESIRDQLWTFVLQHNVEVVHTYLPINSEIELLPFIQKLLDNQITVVCPKTLPKRSLEHRVLKSLNELEEGPMKTYHPLGEEVYSGKYDMIIVPGLAFDENNYRLGYGGGYYDGFLIDHSTAVKVGAFYNFQKVHFVPKEKHDRKLDKVITP